MINKIIDNYFAKKLKDYIQDYCLQWFIDTRIIEDNNIIILQVKQKYYKEEYYTNIMSFLKTNSFYYLLDLKELEKRIKERLENYHLIYDKSKGE